jgi:hypothetical protein
MWLVLCLDVLVIASLVWASRKSLEHALPVFSFVLVVMPLEARIVIPGLFDLSTIRVALLTLFALYLWKGRRRSEVPLQNLMLLHVFWAVCSTLYSLSVVTSLKQLIAQVVEYYLLYFIVLQCITEVRAIHKMLFAVVAALGFCSVLAMSEAYATWSVLSVFPADLWTTYDGRNDPLYVEWGRGLRVRSTFQHPILFGVALSMGIPIALFLLSITRNARERPVLWLSLVVMFWAIYKTTSRGPWLAAALSCVLLFLLVRNQVRQYLAVMAILACAALAIRPGVFDTIVNMYEATQDPEGPVGASFEYRHVLTETVKEEVAKDTGRLLFGFGPGTFRELGLEITFLDSTRRWYTCDNNWALFLYETGYGGLLLIAALLGSALWRNLREYLVLPRPERYLSGVFAISLAGFYFGLLSVAGYAWGQQGFLCWLLIAISIAYPRLARQERKAAKTKSSPTAPAEIQEEQDAIYCSPGAR